MQTSTQTRFHGANAVLTDELEKENDALIKMAQMYMTDKELITTLTWTLS